MKDLLFCVFGVLGLILGLLAMCAIAALGLYLSRTLGFFGVVLFTCILAGSVISLTSNKA
jgi:hypothetical protein